MNPHRSRASWHLLHCDPSNDVTATFTLGSVRGRSITDTIGATLGTTIEKGVVFASATLEASVTLSLANTISSSTNEG